MLWKWIDAPKKNGVNWIFHCLRSFFTVRAELFHSAGKALSQCGWSFHLRAGNTKQTFSSISQQMGQFFKRVPLLMDQDSQSTPGSNKPIIFNVILNTVGHVIWQYFSVTCWFSKPSTFWVDLECQTTHVYQFWN